MIRTKLFIDTSVQGTLIARVVVYWVIFLVYLSTGIIAGQWIQHPEWSLGQHTSEFLSQVWPWIPSFVLTLPLVVHDVIRLSNRFAGPVYRLKQHLLQICKNPNSRALTFREDDCWQDLAEPVNHLQNEIVALQATLNQTRQFCQRVVNKSAS